MRRWALFIAILAVAVPAAGQGGASVHLQVLVKHPDNKGDNSGIVAWLTPTSGVVSPAAPGRFRLVQKNKRFEPHLLVIPVGSVVDFPNEDPFFHNVFSLYKGKRFDLGLYEAGSSKSVHFDRVGVSFIFCNIHPEMSAVLLTMATPYYGVSNAGGELVMRGVPNGSYRLQVWYERASQEALEALAREMTVSGDSSLKLTVSDVLPASVAHKNKYGKDYENAPTYDSH